MYREETQLMSIHMIQEEEETEADGVDSPS